MTRSEPSDEDKQRAAEGPAVRQLYEVAMMRWYADRVDPAEVTRKLASLALPPPARQTYVKLFERARAEIVAMSSALTGDAKRIFLDTALEVYRAREAERAPHASTIAELGVLIDRVKAERAAGTQGVADETLARLAKLRVAYAVACKKDCSRDAIFAGITKQLFWAHVSRGDAPAAMAEATLLDKLDPTAAQEIGARQSKAIGEARGRLARVESARKQGIDADAARSTANGSVTDLGDGRYVFAHHREVDIEWNALVPNAKTVVRFEGKVAGLDRRGATVTVRFQDDVSQWEEATNCRETGRIESISRDGRINYRQECSGTATRTERRKVAPITMPATEAAGLAPGDELFGFATQERVGGRVSASHRSKRLMRVRDVAL